MLRRNLFTLSLILALPSVSMAAGAAAPPSEEPDIYAGWLDMYDLKFDDAHRIFALWRETHPDNPLGPASDAAGYLFSELARLGALESELFVDDARFNSRKKLTPDETIKARLLESLAKADGLANSRLQASANDTDALFVKSLVCGLRADYAALIEKDDMAAFRYSRQGRPFNDKLLSIKPDAYDAYLGLGMENYLLSLKPAALRFILRIAGSRIDREKGLQQLRLTSQHGHYFEPFAKLLLAVAALRSNDAAGARQILAGLHERFPHNPLYERELKHLSPEKK